MDESDVFIYSDPARFDSALNGVKCICFTATSARKNDQLKSEILKDLGFKLFDYWPQGMPKPEKLTLQKVHNEMNEDQTLTFLRAKMKERPVLLYGTQPQREMLKE